MGLGERQVLLLQLREQPHVLNGDDGLVGEGLEEFDLFIQERPWRGASYRNGADGSALSQHGDTENASIAYRAAQGRILELRVKLGVWHVDDRAVENRPRRAKGPGWPRREYAPCRFEGLGGVVVLR